MWLFRGAVATEATPRQQGKSWESCSRKFWTRRRRRRTQAPIQRTKQFLMSEERRKRARLPVWKRNWVGDQPKKNQNHRWELLYWSFIHCLRIHWCIRFGVKVVPVVKLLLANPWIIHLSDSALIFIDIVIKGRCHKKAFLGTPPTPLLKVKIQSYFVYIFCEKYNIDMPGIKILVVTNFSNLVLVPHPLTQSKKNFLTPSLLKRNQGQGTILWKGGMFRQVFQR